MMNLLKRISIGCLPIILVGLNVSCQKTQTASAQKDAARFGENGEPLVEDAEEALEAATNGATEAVQNAGTESRNRFGFSGSDSQVKPLRRDNQSYDDNKPKLKERISNIGSDIKKDVVEAPVKKAVEKVAPPKPPAPAPAPAIVKLGFANSVPGDPLYVTLPGEYANVGTVSVERRDASGNRLGTAWARGTTMQIPNPKVEGGTIYFKVP